MIYVAVIDYGLGNLHSVANALKECGAEIIITDQSKDIENASAIVLPGVGSFKDGMANLKKSSLDRVLTEQVIQKRIPFLGICLGMQLMAQRGHEGGITEGLGWIEGEVKPLVPSDKTTRLPHVGWNELHFRQHSSVLFNKISDKKDFYFVHRYHMCNVLEENILAQTPYCGNFISVIGKDNLFGVQFHPEKSQRPGFQLLNNFLVFAGIKKS